MTGSTLRAAPFRVGATSFVVPAGWLENARRLAGVVEDVSLLLWEDPRRPGSTPDAGEVRGLARLAEETGLGYTVHAPCERSLTDPDDARRAEAVGHVLHAAALLAPLRPGAFVVHLDRPEPPPGGQRAWTARARGALRALVEGGIPAERVCVETLDAGFEAVAPLVEEEGVAVALDLGHFADDPGEAERLLARHLSRARVVHWHGKVGARDHRSLRHFPAAPARRILRALRAARWDGVLTLEVFHEADLAESLATLSALDAEEPT